MKTSYDVPKYEYSQICYWAYSKRHLHRKLWLSTVHIPNADINPDTNIVIPDHNLPVDNRHLFKSLTSWTPASSEHKYSNYLSSLSCQRPRPSTSTRSPLHQPPEYQSCITRHSYIMFPDCSLIVHCLNINPRLPDCLRDIVNIESRSSSELLYFRYTRVSPKLIYHPKVFEFLIEFQHE